jgi:hypothetical protein
MIRSLELSMIFVCFFRRRNLKYQEKQDHCLLPEQSERISKRNSV